MAAVIWHMCKASIASLLYFVWLTDSDSAPWLTKGAAVVVCGFLTHPPYTTQSESSRLVQYGEFTKAGIDHDFSLAASKVAVFCHVMPYEGLMWGRTTMQLCVSLGKRTSRLTH
uniref:Putative secreted protein n=1 Tax=Ixodes ricinus TaxID=34613 RepID=A0A6B0UKH2_IXORI